MGSTRRTLHAALLTAAGLVVGAALAAGCGATPPSISVSAPSAVYSQQRFFTCTRARKLISATSPLSKIRPPLRDVPGVRGIVQIASGANPPSGINVGPPIDSVSLIFLTTPTLARKGEPKVWAATYDPRIAAEVSRPETAKRPRQRRHHPVVPPRAAPSADQPPTQRLLRRKSHLDPDVVVSCGDSPGPVLGNDP
jgi:hypothetical protein